MKTRLCIPGSLCVLLLSLLIASGFISACSPVAQTPSFSHASGASATATTRPLATATSTLLPLGAMPGWRVIFEKQDTITNSADTNLLSLGSFDPEKTFAVQASCQGTGRITVDVSIYHMTFPCPSSTFAYRNQMAPAPGKQTDVLVKVQGAITWHVLLEMEN